MRLRSLVLALLVAGLLVIGVSDLFAHRPPTWDAKIPIYLGDPDDPYLRPRWDKQPILSSASLEIREFGFRILGVFVENIARGLRVVGGRCDEERVLCSGGRSDRDRWERKR